MESLSNLVDTHVLRLSLDFYPTYNTLYNLKRECVLSTLPQVWVYDEDYVHISDAGISNRNRLSQLTPRDFSNLISIDESSKNWKIPNIINSRESNLLRVIQNIPQIDHLADAYRLDVLLEDYLDQVWIYNKHKLTLGFLGEEMPTVDCVHILLLPHKIRIDFAALLTSTILFDLPLSVLL